MNRLRLIPGAKPDTWTLGYRSGTLLFRDPRFAAFMSEYEAKWLLLNEDRNLPPKGRTSFLRGKIYELQ